MSKESRPSAFGRRLRRHSLVLVAALGGAAGVAYAAGRHAKAPAPKVTVFAWSKADNTPAAIATPAELPRDTVQDTVQIALLLDTSSSMDGLINQARSQLWTMVDQMGRMTRVVDGKTRGVRVELALFEYGNTRIPAADGYIRQVLPLTGDLDRVSEQLGALFTNGGDEYVGQAITKAVSSLAWSKDPAAMKFVFVAGNEEFDQGPVSAAAAMKAAAGADIHVQLIYCGNEEPTWKAAANLAASDLMTIDQNVVAQAIAAPQDDEILRLGNELNGTYLAYGADGAAAMARQSGADAASAKLSKKVALERSQLKAKAAYRNDTWDVVDAIEKDADFLGKATPDALPAELRGKSQAEQRQIIASKAAARADLKAKLAKLEADRTAFIAAEQAKNAGPEQKVLETELMKSTKKVAAKKGYKF